MKGISNGDEKISSDMRMARDLITTRWQNSGATDSLRGERVSGSAVVVASRNRRQEARLLPCLRQLLERIGNLQQRGFAPCTSEEGQPDRQPPQLSTAHGAIAL